MKLYRAIDSYYGKKFWSAKRNEIDRWSADRKNYLDDKGVTGDWIEIEEIKNKKELLDILNQMN